MSPDIHPEDLLDRERSRGLTHAEQVRLTEHLASCSSCRIERMLAADFADERELLDASFDAPSATPSSRSADQRRPPGGRSSQAPHPAFHRAIRRAAILGAALLLAGGAAALNGGLAWIAPVEPKAATQSATSATPSPSGAKAKLRTSATPSAPAAPAPAAVDADAGPAATNLDADSANPAGTASAALAAPSRPGASSGQGLQATPTAAVRRTATTLFDAASLARREGRYEAALALYARLEQEFPGSVEASTAKALRARIELDLGRPAAAATAFKAASAEDSPLSEVALVGEAQALGRAGRTEAEARTWKLLIQRFPQSPHRPLAQARLRQLGAD